MFTFPLIVSHIYHNQYQEILIAILVLSFLSLTGKLQDKLQDFLSKLLDGSEGTPIKSPPLRHERTQDLYKEYATAMQLVGMSSTDEPVEQWPQVQGTCVCCMKGVCEAEEMSEYFVVAQSRHYAYPVCHQVAITWLSYDRLVTKVWTAWRTYGCCCLEILRRDGFQHVGIRSGHCKQGMWRSCGNHMV